MLVTVQVRNDPRMQGVLERIATSLEDIATTLKTETEPAIDPAEVAAQTGRLGESSDALDKIVHENPVPAS